MTRAGQLSELAREFTVETDYKRATEKMKAAHAQNPLAVAFLGVLAAIGVEKGKPFAPDARMKEILTESKDLVTNPDTRVHRFNRSQQREHRPKGEFPFPLLPPVHTLQLT